MTTYDGARRKDSGVVLPLLGGCNYHKDCPGHSIVFHDDPGLTKQSFKDECDINLIIARAALGADISHVNARVAQFGDFSNIPDYQTSLDLVNRAQGMFMDLPANVRERFLNDPGKMVAFLQDDKNYDEAVQLGLVVPKAKAADPAAAPVKAPEGAAK